MEVGERAGKIVSASNRWRKNFVLLIYGLDWTQFQKKNSKVTKHGPAEMTLHLTFTELNPRL